LDRNTLYPEYPTIALGMNDSGKALLACGLPFMETARIGFTKAGLASDSVIGGLYRAIPRNRDWPKSQ